MKTPALSLQQRERQGQGTPKVIDVGSGTQLWGAQFKEPYSEILVRPEKLADKICHRLRLVLAPNMSTRRRERPERAA